MPIVGKVTAGLPITAVENVEEFFPLPENLAPSDEQLFMLEVMGESMIEAANIRWRLCYRSTANIQQITGILWLR